MTLVPIGATKMVREMHTNEGKSVLEFSNEKPVFLVFLRHFGCVFCKEALSDIAKIKTQLSEKRIKLIFVHMASNEIAEEYFHQFDLSGATHVSNPEKNFYMSFGLMKGSISQLYGLRTWIRGFSPKTKGYKLELNEQLGDSTQMPGMFLIHQGKTIGEYIHKTASDHPDYEAFIDQAMKLV